MLGDQIDVVGVHDFGDDRQADAPARVFEQGQALVFHPLERVGRGARLVGAAAQQMGARPP